MVGYPDGLMDLSSNYPLIRKGITSLHPAITFNKSSNKSLGILDISAFPGSSGSPIFVFNEGNYQKPGQNVEISKKLILLGVLSEEGTNSFNTSDSDKYHLNLGPYVKASELLVLGKEVKKVHIQQINSEITETIEKELETAQNLSSQSLKFRNYACIQ